MEPPNETVCGDWQDIGCYGTTRRDSMWRLTGHWVLWNHQTRQYVATDRTLGVMEPSDETVCGDWQDIGCYGTIRQDSMWRLTGHWVLWNHQTRQYVPTDRTLGVMEPPDERVCGDWQDIGCYGTTRRDSMWRLTGHWVLWNHQTRQYVATDRKLKMFSVILNSIALLLRVQKVPGSDLWSYNGCYYWQLSLFSSVNPVNTEMWATKVFFHILCSCHQQVILHSDVTWTRQMINRRLYMVKESCPCAWHEGMWGSGGVAPLSTLALGRDQRSASPPRRFTVCPLIRRLIGSRSRSEFFEGMKNLELLQGIVRLSEIISRVECVVWNVDGRTSA